MPTTGNGRVLNLSRSALHGAARRSAFFFREKDRITGDSLRKVYNVIREDAADDRLTVTHAVKGSYQFCHICAAACGVRLLCCYT